MEHYEITNVWDHHRAKVRWQNEELSKKNVTISHLFIPKLAFLGALTKSKIENFLNVGDIAE